jgi:hypothetical protein
VKAEERFNNEKLLILLQKDGVNDGARTHDNRNHNPCFYGFIGVDWCL